MEQEAVKKVIEENYPIRVIEVVKLKNIYKVICPNEQYCLKTIKYNFGHFFFIISAMKHLYENNFEGSIPIIKTIANKDYIEIQSCFAYLIPWKEARIGNYDNILDIISAAEVLAKLHIKSRGFKVTENMNPRIGWFKWIETFRTRKDEILDFKKRILDKDIKSEFDYMYLVEIEQEVLRAERAISNLLSSEYVQIMEKHIKTNGFCHHDFAHHNLLFADKKIYVIDFDYCILDTHLHDLASLILRSLKNGRWNIKGAEMILNKYSSINEVEEEEIPVIAAFMEFPQDFWQVGIQYYWEKHPWGEEFFINKLSKILDDREDKQEFVGELRKYKMGG